MTIAAVTTTKNEQDIVEATVRNLLEQGVDLILAADSSTDDTPNILERLGATVFHVDEPIHRQPYWMNRLAAHAHDLFEAEWIVPFDADEFWFAPNGGDLWAYFDSLPLDTTVVRATLWHHRDPNFKYVPAERLPKVAFRWTPGAVIANGNHSVTSTGGVGDGLEIRHYQFRGFQHFKEKVRERSRTLDPAARARGDGSHMTRFEHADAVELLVAWQAHTSQEVVYDPIPIHGDYRIGARAA